MPVVRLVRYHEFSGSRWYTELFPDALEFIQISLILLLVLDLLPDTLKNPNGGRVVVDATGGTKGSLNNRRRRNQIVGEAVIQTTLDLEQILGLLEELDVALGEGFESFLVRGGGGGASEGWGDPTDGRPGAEESNERGGRTHSWWFEGKESGKDEDGLLSVMSDCDQTRSESDVALDPFSSRFPAVKHAVCMAAFILQFSSIFLRLFPANTMQKRQGTDEAATAPARLLPKTVLVLDHTQVPLLNFW
jgi:hypothetical protein